MRESGIPIRVQRGPGDGHLFDVRSNLEPISLDPDEVAALIVALVALGPTATGPPASDAFMFHRR